MKRKIFYYVLMLTALLLSGCSSQTTQKAENTPAENKTEVQTEITDDHAADNTAGSSAENNTVQPDLANGETISEEKAKEIALSHAGLTADQVTFIKSGLDIDNNRKHYDIEFYTADHQEYDYEIDPASGAIIDYDYDAEYYAQGTDTPEGEPISADEAKQIALNQVPGAAASDIREFKTDGYNNRMKYEGKIYYDQKEYEFEIDAYDGSIREWEVEPIYGAVS